MTEEKLSYYINKAADLSKQTFDKNIRIAILGSFTLNGLAETIQVKCAEKKIQCTTYTGSYNQYNQEILNSKSDLYKFNPDITFLFIDARAALKDLFHHPYSISKEERKQFVDTTIQEILNLAKKFSETTKSKLVLAKHTKNIAMTNSLIRMPVSRLALRCMLRTKFIRNSVVHSLFQNWKTCTFIRM